jgi:hypothetical protein
MNDILDLVTDETISIIYKGIKKHKNKHRINYIINTLINSATIHFQPYLYTIMAILVLIFFMICVQFFYYAKYTNILNV